MHSTRFKLGFAIRIENGMKAREGCDLREAEEGTCRPNNSSMLCLDR